MSKEEITFLQNKAHNQKKQLKTYQNNVKYYKRKYQYANEEIERLHSIIKEVREYIKNIPDDEFVESEHFTELLEILDKENNNEDN